MVARSTVTAAALVVASLTSKPLPAQDSLWTFESPGTILGWLRTAAGVLLVETDHGLVGVNGETGVSRWQRPDLGSRPEARPGSPTQDIRLGYILSKYGIVQVDSARAAAYAVGFDINTGETTWDSRRLIPGDVRGIQVLRGDSLVMLIVQEARGRPATIAAVNAATGDLRWTLRGDLGEATLFEQLGWKPRPRATADLGPEPKVDSDTTLMLFLSPAGPVRVDRRDGRIVWRMRGDSASPGRARFPLRAPQICGGLLFAPAERRLVVLDTVTGQPRWPGRIQFDGVPSGVDSVAGGWLVRSEPAFDRTGKFYGRSEMTVLDAASGKSRWLESERRRSTTSDPVLLGDSLAVADGGKLYIVSLSDGGRRLVYDFGATFWGIAFVDTVGSDFRVAARLMYAQASRSGELRFRQDWGPLDERYAAPTYFYEGALVVAGQFKTGSDSTRPPAAIPGQGVPDSVYRPMLVRVDLETGTVTHRVPFDHRSRDFGIWREARLVLVRADARVLKAYRF